MRGQVLLLDKARTFQERKRARARLSRIRGQIKALEQNLQADVDCAPVLQQLAAIRGAVNGLMAEVLQSYLCEEFEQIDSSITPGRSKTSIDQVIALVRSYLK